MKIKKLLSLLITGVMICTFSTSAFAEFFSVSAGIPLSHTFKGEWSGSGGKVESDGVSGYMLHVKFPIMVGVGLEAYDTNIKAPDGANFDNMKLSTQLYDVFYLLPVPIVNITLGVGAGNTSLDCDVSGGASCDDFYEAGTAYQWWAQFGFPIFPFLDVHASYHDVTAKVKGKDSNDDLSFNGNVIALGVAFVF
jgi:hypothetical protein